MCPSLLARIFIQNLKELEDVIKYGVSLVNVIPALRAVSHQKQSPLSVCRQTEAGRLAGWPW